MSELIDGICSTFFKHIFPIFTNIMKFCNSWSDDSDEIEFFLTYIFTPYFTHFFALNQTFIVQTIEYRRTQMRKSYTEFFHLWLLPNKWLFQKHNKTQLLL